MIKQKLQQLTEHLYFEFNRVPLEGTVKEQMDRCEAIVLKLLLMAKEK